MKFIISFVMAIAMLSFVPPADAGCRGNRCHRARVAVKVLKPMAVCRCGDVCNCTVKNNCGCKTKAPVAKVLRQGGCANGVCGRR